MITGSNNVIKLSNAPYIEGSAIALIEGRQELESHVNKYKISTTQGSIIIELVDARAPYSSKNPMINDLIKQKPRLIVLTKKDMADDELTKQWLKLYESQGYRAISVNLKNFNEYSKIIDIY